MQNLYKIVILLLFLQTKATYGQDMHFTQFYAAPLYLNPAFSGANVCSRMTLVYRNQWPGVKQAYQSYLLSLDHFFTKQNLGMGLLCGVDNAGTGGLRTTIIHPSFAYEIKINKFLAVRLGIQPGVTIKSINFEKLVFGDQLARGGNTGASSVTTVEKPTQNKAFFDIGTGALIYTSKLWLGVSFFHLNRPNESFYELDNVVLPIRYSVHGGTKFYLNEDEKDPALKKSVSIVAHYRGQGKFDQFDLGVYYSQSVMTFGLWYRGIPGLKSYKAQYRNDDAVAAVIGFQKDRLNIGYSYDITISQLQGLTQGAHEITLSYQFCKKKTKTKRVLISCPKF
ncbi:MAG: type IX secretion system membrane protein PorP/SprF [Bacteroidota bacterium]